MTKESSDHAIRGNAEILLSENYSDFTIYCGGKTFQVHRAIICPPSTYFKALCGINFREGGEACATIEDEDPVIFAHILVFLYLGGISLITRKIRERVPPLIIRQLSTKLQIPQMNLGKLMLQRIHGNRYGFLYDYSFLTRIYIAADKYMLDGLKRTAVDAYRVTAKILSDQKHEDVTQLQTPQDFLGSMRMIYSSMAPGDTKLKEMALHYANQLPALLQDKVLFDEIVKESPDLAFDLVKIEEPKSISHRDSATRQVLMDLTGAFGGG